MSNEDVSTVLRREIHQCFAQAGVGLTSDEIAYIGQASRSELIGLLLDWTPEQVQSWHRRTTVLEQDTEEQQDG